MSEKLNGRRTELKPSSCSRYTIVAKSSVRLSEPAAYAVHGLQLDHMGSMSK